MNVDRVPLCGDGDALLAQVYAADRQARRELSRRHPRIPGGGDPVLLRQRSNEVTREHRLWLYRNDPVWRLTKLKDNRERKWRLAYTRGDK